MTSDGATFSQGVWKLCLELATAIVRDAEGATKLVGIAVEGPRTWLRRGGWRTPSPTRPWSRRRCSPPTPTGDASSRPSVAQGVDGLDIDRVGIWLGEVLIVRDGGTGSELHRGGGRRGDGPPEILIRVTLGRGDVETRVLTCDLSYDYVRINAEYRT